MDASAEQSAPHEKVRIVFKIHSMDFQWPTFKKNNHQYSLGQGKKNT